jgi:hypothetical protein
MKKISISPPETPDSQNSKKLKLFLSLTLSFSTLSVSKAETPSLSLYLRRNFHLLAPVVTRTPSLPLVRSGGFKIPSP